MGVIDLDARVKKLEEGGGGAEIDQIEADLTALENVVSGNGETTFGLEGDVAALETTVNGDGETSFGLVGDVADLGIAVGNLCKDVTDKFTLNTGITYASGSPKYAVTQIGNLCFLQFEATIQNGAGSIGQDTTLGTLDSSIRPGFEAGGHCIGTGGGTYNCRVTTGGSVVETGGSTCKLTVFWKIATT